MTEDYVRNFFFERHVEPKNDWLRATIDFLSKSNADRTLSNDQIAESLYEQWLYSDIGDSSQPCLNIPPNAAKFVVSASIVVQIKSILDIGTPLLAQFQKLTKSTNENTTVTASEGNDNANIPAWEPKPRRMLWFEVTDGNRSLRAMEYRPITDMDAMTPPGAKLLLFGEIVCRNGVLLLSSENCQLLGGDVDILAENNHPVKMMADKLKKDIPRPKNALSGQALRPTQTNVPPSSNQQLVEAAPPPRSTLMATQSHRPAPPPEKPVARAAPAQATTDTSRIIRPRTQENIANTAAPFPPPPAPISETPTSRPPPPPSQQPTVKPPPSQTISKKQDNWSTSSSVNQHLPRSSASRSPATAILQSTQETTARQTAPYWPSTSSFLANASGALRQSVPLTQESHDVAFTQATQAPHVLLPTQAAPLSQTSRSFAASDRPKPINSSPAPAQRTRAPVQAPPRSIQPKQESFDDDAFSRLEPALQSQPTSPPYMQPSQQSSLQNFAPIVPHKLQKVGQGGPDLHELNLTFINDAVRATRYAIGTQLRTLKAVLITVLSPMRIEGGRWMLKIRISDGTANLDCSFDDALLSRLLCMTVAQAQELSQSSDQARKDEGNMRIKSLELSMRRMDLLFDVELSAGNRAMPVIRNMITLSEKFNCF